MAKKKAKIVHLEADSWETVFYYANYYVSLQVSIDRVTGEMTMTTMNNHDEATTVVMPPDVSQELIRSLKKHEEKELAYERPPDFTHVRFDD